MRCILMLLAVGLAAVSAGPFKDEYSKSQRIVGGSVTTIQTYPEMAALLHSSSGANHRQTCAGTVLNNRSILSAAHCFHGPGQGHTPNRWRVRLGSSYANSGGSVFNTARFISHPLYSFVNLDNDIGILHVSSAISFNNNIRPGRIAGANYGLGDNQVVWAAGWGFISEEGPSSEQLRHVQIWTINQQTCKNQYAVFGLLLTDNMLCSGWLNVGGRGQCNFDDGGPLFHNGVVVGVSSFGEGCGRPDFASVNARVSPYAAWINGNA